MNELLEKLKSLDRRILIGAGIGIAVVIIVVIALVAGGSDKPENGKNTQSGTEIDSQFGVETENGTELLGGTEILGTEFETELGTEIGTEIGTEAGSEVTGETNPSENQSQTGTAATPGEDIAGAGSSENPYLLTPDLNNMTVTTFTIPAGQSVYYGIYRVGNMWLELADANAYIIESDGTRHDAQNGVVEFKVEDKMANEYVTFQIGNKGSSPAVFTISFGNIKGTQENPEKVTALGSVQKTIAAGSDKGYMYRYVAENTGTIRFYFSDWSKNCGMEVTNNAVSKQMTFDTIVYSSEPSEGYPEDYSVDEQGRRYIEMSVNAGDEIIIRISAVPDSKKKYPKVDCTWVAEWR